ncbi:MAG: hypothetical protein ACJ8FY_02365 [Gemmataceae bacterium]
MVAIYGDAAKPDPGQYTRLEPTIALVLKAGEAPHPRLAANGGSARWEGFINITRAGRYRFRALVSGNFHLWISNKEVLAASVKSTNASSQVGAEVDLEEGIQALIAEFTWPVGGGQLDVSWQGKGFRYEPLPYDVLGHLPAKAPAQLGKDQQIERGRYLAEEHNCLACHRAGTPSLIEKALVPRKGPDLTQIGKRAFPGWIYHWLADPEKLRPGALMPRLFTDDEAGKVERHAIAVFLATLGGPLKKSEVPVKEGKQKVNTAEGERFFTSLGCIACHAISQKNAKPQDDPDSSIAKSSFLPAPRTFPLFGLGSKTNQEWLAEYLSNPLAFDPSGRMPSLLLQGHESHALALYLCQSHVADIAVDLPAEPTAETVATAFKLTEPQTEKQAEFARQSRPNQLVALGKKLVVSKGCVNCHVVFPPQMKVEEQYASSLDQWMKPGSLQSGCLAESAAKRGRAPAFSFDEEARKSLRAFFTDGTRGPGSPAPAYAARNTMERFNCLACHVRDGDGGLAPTLVQELRKAEKADNAEAISPPTLTGIGHKLRTTAFREVLVHANRARPWMGLRMPQFGEANVGHLPEQVAALEGAGANDESFNVSLTPELLSAGKKLIGKNGFGCISCHDMAGVPNTGTRGPDLAHTTQRVRYDWYVRWMEQPQRMQPGTRMPTVFLDGKSILDTVLAGHVGSQEEAMWGYLSLGQNMPLPEGLEPPKGLALAVRDKPVLLRTFLPDAGTHAIAVGYPGGVSLAFDSTTCRVAFAWSGNFLDASPVWNDRGGNPAKVLGARFAQAPAGCPLLVSSSVTAPDFTAQGKDPAYGAQVPEGQVYLGPRQLRFEGYRLNKEGLPLFRYRLRAALDDAVSVEEFPQPLLSPSAVGLKRQFTLDVPAGMTPWFMAGESGREPRMLENDGKTISVDWKSGSIELAAKDRVVVLPQDADRALLLKVPGASEKCIWRIQHSDGKWQVILGLPRTAQASKVSFNLETWSLYRDEPAFIKEVLHVK